MKNKIKAEIISHSKRKDTGEEIITYKLTFPRIILSEVNTYGSLSSRNTSSSRAVPFEKMVEVVEKEPFVPIAWSKPHKGMQGTDYYTVPNTIESKVKMWLEARNTAVLASKKLDVDTIYVKERVCLDYRDIVEDNYKMVKHETFNPVTKQLKNRLLEPFMWVVQLITGTRESFEHLFEQRCPIYPGGCKSWKELCDLDSNYSMEASILEKLQVNKGQAEIHFMDLAEKMYDALNESKPIIMGENDWHIPFSDRPEFTPEMSLKDKIMLSCAMTARVSYTTIEDNETLTLEKAKRIYDKCVQQGHFSVVSHCAKCMTTEEYETWIKGKVQKDNYADGYSYEVPKEAKGFNKNLRGFISLRQYVEDNVDLNNI